jgi:hypothetical protein
MSWPHALGVSRTRSRCWWPRELPRVRSRSRGRGGAGPAAARSRGRRTRRGRHTGPRPSTWAVSSGLSLRSRIRAGERGPRPLRRTGARPAERTAKSSGRLPGRGRSARSEAAGMGEGAGDRRCQSPCGDLPVQPAPRSNFCELYSLRGRYGRSRREPRRRGSRRPDGDLQPCRMADVVMAVPYGRTRPGPDGMRGWSLRPGGFPPTMV